MKQRLIMFLAVFVMGTLAASAESKSDYPSTIKVLSARTESVPLSSDSNEVPTDCGIQDFSAYCHESRRMVVRNTMLVQDEKGKPYTISCTVDSRWSNCISLPVGETFGAQKEKHGFTIWYQNSKGKEVKQSYTVIVAGQVPAASGARPSSTVVTPASSTGTAASSGGSSAASSVAPSAAPPEATRETVKCNFTSTPAGAEITLDGRYVGNTPSVVGVTTGTHVIVLFMPGFERWRRELTVPSGSDLSISATLQKAAQ